MAPRATRRAVAAAAPVIAFTAALTAMGGPLAHSPAIADDTDRDIRALIRAHPSLDARTIALLQQLSHLTGAPLAPRRPAPVRLALRPLPQLAGLLRLIPAAVTPQGTRRIVAICTAGGRQWRPRISGDTIVWADQRDEALGYDIYAYTRGRGEWVVCSAPGDQINPDIDGDFIVWQDERGADADIYGYDPRNGVRPIFVGPGQQTNPAVSGNRVVWVDWTHRTTGRGTDIYLWDPDHGTRLVGDYAGNQQAPDIWGDTVVWQDGREFDLTGWNIMAWDPQRGERGICFAIGNQTDPAICAGRVVWVDDSNAGARGTDIYECDAANPSDTMRVVCDAPGDQTYPRVSLQRIVWTDCRAGANNPDIYTAVGTDIQPLAAGPGAQYACDVDGDNVVWTYAPDDWFSVNQDIHGWLDWPMGKPGDVNGDQTVDDADIVYFMNAWRQAHTGGNVDSSCDLDGDGDFDHDDAVRFVDAVLSEW